MEYVPYILCTLLGYILCHLHFKMKRHVALSSWTSHLTVTTKNGIATYEYQIHDGCISPLPDDLIPHNPEAGFNCECYICMR